MKRDMDLIRKIMLELEASSYDGVAIDIKIEGYSSEAVNYHVMLLNEAGLIKAQDFSSLSGPDWIPERLTWAGHEFIEASRDQSRWEKAITMMKEKGGGVAFDVLSALLIQLMKGAVLGP